jgi:thioredoxin reductase (NADPH)
VLHRRDEFRASAIMLDRAREIENIEFVTPYVPIRFEAGDDGALAKAVLRHSDTAEEREVEVDGVFVAIGHRPTSRIVEGLVPLDEDGYVLTQGKSTRTDAPGVFAAGDLVDRIYRQAVTAAGSGCQAALDAEWYLRDTPVSAEVHWHTPDEIERDAEQVAESTDVRAAAEPAG